MFNAIFLACWSELLATQQAELADSLQQALTTQNISEITQTLLNLAEFMEHCDKVIFHFPPSKTYLFWAVHYKI